MCVFDESNSNWINTNLPFSLRVFFFFFSSSIAILQWRWYSFSWVASCSLTLTLSLSLRSQRNKRRERERDMATTNDEREPRQEKKQSCELCSAYCSPRAVAITDFYCVSLCLWQTENMHLCAWEPRFSYYYYSSSSFCLQ